MVAVANENISRSIYSQLCFWS